MFRYWMRRGLAVLVGGLLLGATVSTQAAAGVDIDFTPGCDGFVSSTASTLVLDRDNTGFGREAFALRGLDGAGNEIFYAVRDSFLVGEAVTFGAGELFGWTTRPLSNPLLVEIISLSGNGLPQQVVYRATGTCASLVTAANPPVGAQTILAIASEPYPINGTPPSPTNPPGVAEANPGYGIVATDNLFLRTGPGIEFRPVGVLNGGTTLIVLARNTGGLPDNDDGLWWFVEVGGFRGWVKSTLITLRGDLSNSPVAVAQGVLDVPRVISGFPTYPLYENPSGQGVICNLQGGLEYVVLSRNDNPFSAWQVEGICPNGTVAIGWVLAEDVTFRNPGERPVPITPVVGR